MTRFAPQTLQPLKSRREAAAMSLLGRVVKAHILNVTPESVFEKAHSRWGMALFCLIAAGILLLE